MTRAVWFGCSSGIAGDMALGALVDAGVSLATVEAACRRVALPDPWSIRAEPVSRAGVTATHVVVEVDADQARHRAHAEIADRIGAADLPARVAERALAVFARLAEVEGAIHGVDPADVEFHEIGATDSIVDIVGVCAALEAIDAGVVAASPVAVGHGTVRSAHGLLPNPPPAVSRLLAGVGAAVVGVDLPVELTTPTGAALLAVLAQSFGPPPAMQLQACGFGAGGKDLAGRANVTQVLVGAVAVAATTHTSAGGAPGATEPLAVVETTVDDVTGEVLGRLVGVLLAAGAVDAWLAPVVMKKGRPGHVVTALCPLARIDAVRAALVAETGTLGVRHHEVSRWAAARRLGAVNLAGHRVGIKASAARAKAEHDDVVVAAAALGLPVREVAARAEQLWANLADSQAGPEG